jgi:manganese/zinc/iron transport system permease protein
MVIAGALLGVLGVVLNLRRSALMGDVMSHAVLPGAALGMMVGGARDSWLTFFGAGMGALVWAWLTPLMRRVTGIRGDAAAGVMLAGALSLGLLLVGRIQAVGGAATAGLDRVFFGQASLLSEGQLVLMGTLAMGVIAWLVVMRNRLRLWCFSEVSREAAVDGAGWVGRLFMVILAVSVAVSIQSMGAVLVGTMLIVPALCGLLVARRFEGVLAVSGMAGAVAGLGGGIFSATRSGVPSGAAAAVCAGVLLVLVSLTRAGGRR